jgi:hypothetical protein
MNNKNSTWDPTIEDAVAFLIQRGFYARLREWAAGRSITAAVRTRITDGVPELVGGLQIFHDRDGWLLSEGMGHPVRYTRLAEAVEAAAQRLSKYRDV